MDTRGLDALILSNIENVRFVTDVRPLNSSFHSTQYQALVVPNERPFLLATEADASFLEDEMPWVNVELTPSFAPADQLVASKLESINRVLPASTSRLGWDSLDRFISEGIVGGSSGMNLEYAGSMMLAIRSVKSVGELVIMKRAVEFAALGYEAVQKAVAPKVPEYVLAAESTYAMMRAGAESESHTPAIRSGDRAAREHRMVSNRRLEIGDTVIADVGARHLGYSAEWCRTYAVDKIAKNVAEMHAVLIDALEAGIEKALPGESTLSVDSEIRNRISSAGYEVYRHSTGHGIGMANGEMPAVNSVSDQVLQPGMVICLEPGIYVPGLAGVKEEQMVAITETGVEVLSAVSPYDDQMLVAGQ